MASRSGIGAMVVALALLGARAAAAEEAPRQQKPPPRVEYEKKTVINFDDDTIQGDLTRPDGEYVEARKKVGHSSLIRIRESWREKVKQAGSEL
ncbi:MAG TPA: adventurous gliding motility protein CglF [Anaeromyxobacteraceae bacterium]|jgi:hypothetical protein|nr:adventurous gliding motility protein CglF [Anaeromyxobacteraceae bacterium]